ncbi:MAG TPA: hypothetical protein VJH97_05960 [Candidatus Nanoarchaeia archaeon]|nr:hypothetical protein [Candidatus Nanoarchaeia archaeon]
MVDIREHPVTRSEISIIEIKGKDGIRFKVTRRIPDLSVSETRIFTSKEEAKRQFNEWLE